MKTFSCHEIAYLNIKRLSGQKYKHINWKLIQHTIYKKWQKITLVMHQSLRSQTIKPTDRNNFLRELRKTEKRIIVKNYQNLK